MAKTVLTETPSSHSRLREYQYTTEAGARITVQRLDHGPRDLRWSAWAEGRCFGHASSRFGIERLITRVARLAADGLTPRARAMLAAVAEMKTPPTEFRRGWSVARYLVVEAYVRRGHPLLTAEPLMQALTLLGLVLLDSTDTGVDQIRLTEAGHAAYCGSHEGCEPSPVGGSHA